MTLYELTGEYLRLLDIAESESDPTAIADTMECIEGDIEDKVDSYAAVIKSLDADTAEIDAEIKRLQARRKTIVTNCAEIKKRLMESMILMGKRKIKTALHTFTVAKNGGRTPLKLNDGVIATDLPSDLVRVTYTPDMDMIRVMVENGDTTWAHFEERGETLRIK